MSNINPSFNNDSGPHFSDVSLHNAMEETMYLVQHLEPKVRELNRHYRDVLGTHPNSPDGNWVFLSKSIDGSYLFSFHPISANRITLHAASVADNAELIDSQTNDLMMSGTEYVDLGSQILGEVASLSWVPSTHVHVERRP